MRQQIYFYHTGQPYDIFSNVTAVPVELGIHAMTCRALSSEALYQGAKGLALPGKLVDAIDLIQDKNPPGGHLQQKGQQFQNPLFKDDARYQQWTIKEQLMYEILLAKATQHPLLLKALFATGTARIIEDTDGHSRDDFWGNAAPRRLNKLGKIWQKIRTDLWHELQTTGQIRVRDYLSTEISRALGFKDSTPFLLQTTRYLTQASLDALPKAPITVAELREAEERLKNSQAPAAIAPAQPYYQAPAAAAAVNNTVTLSLDQAQRAFEAYGYPNYGRHNPRTTTTALLEEFNLTQAPPRPTQTPAPAYTSPAAAVYITPEAARKPAASAAEFIRNNIAGVTNVAVDNPHNYHKAIVKLTFATSAQANSFVARDSDRIYLDPNDARTACITTAGKGVFPALTIGTYYDIYGIKHITYDQLTAEARQAQPGYQPIAAAYTPPTATYAPAPAAYAATPVAPAAAPAAPAPAYSYSAANNSLGFTLKQENGKWKVASISANAHISGQIKVGDTVMSVTLTTPDGQSRLSPELLQSLTNIWGYVPEGKSLTLCLEGADAFIHSVTISAPLRAQQQGYPLGY